ncbi:MAG TPA: hypothetical protein VGG48_17450 [Rhizomicrobium sp.]
MTALREPMAPQRQSDGFAQLLRDSLAGFTEHWTPAFIARSFKDNRNGLAGAVLLHGLILLLLLFVWPKTVVPARDVEPPFVAVQVVRLGPETIAPLAPAKSAVPQQRAAHIPVPRTTSPKREIGIAPNKTKPVEDALDSQLKGLSKLKQPTVPLHAPDNDATSDIDSTSEGAVPGDSALYSLRDYVRAQVEQRWSLDLATLGKSNPTIQLRVEMTRRGVILKSEIVDQERFKKDAAFHEIALSARNAVLLSSPISLPPGDYQNIMDFTLSLKPRDALR